MNKLKLLMLFFMSTFFVPNVYGFASETHTYVTRKSLSILEDMAQKERKKRLENEGVKEASLKGSESEEKRESSGEPTRLEKANDFYIDKYKDILVKYSVKPDEDEIDGGFKWHFYNPATELNFMGEKDSALTRFINHYNTAVVNYNTDYIDEAFQEFSRALHFLEDLSTPVHTNYENFIDAGIKLSMHVEFEKRCVAVQEDCVAQVAKENIRYYLNNTKTIICKNCAYLSADLFYSLERRLLPQDTLARYSVLNAQRAVVGLLCRFYVDVTNWSDSDPNVNLDKDLANEIQFF